MPLFHFFFRHEAGHQSVGDGGAYPDFGEHKVGIFIDGLKINVDVVECGNERIDNKDHP